MTTCNYSIWVVGIGKFGGHTGGDPTNCNTSASHTRPLVIIMYVFSLDDPIMFMNSVDTEKMMALYNFGQFQYIYINYSDTADYI